MSGIVSAVVVGNADELHDGPPGAIRYWRYDGEPESKGPAGLNFRCPCGCGLIGSLSFRPVNSADQGRAMWSWNGDRDRPTCTPSIGFYGMRTDGQHHWHGYLTDGEFRPC